MQATMKKWLVGFFVCVYGAMLLGYVMVLQPSCQCLPCVGTGRLSEEHPVFGVPMRAVLELGVGRRGLGEDFDY
jgi:hypothetical protein